jgi:hypothetical protein
MSRSSRVACHFRLANISLIGLLACIWILGYLKCSAQSSTISPGTIRCADCPLTAQKPTSQPFDEKRFQFITTPKPIALEGGFFESTIIGRVLVTSPLIVEILDSDFRRFDSNGRPLQNIAAEQYEPDICGIRVYDYVDRNSKTVLPTLRFNDLVTARWFYSPEESKPDDLFSSKIVVSDVRKVTETLPYFHDSPGKDFCANRSGRLIVYHGLFVDLVTVYNDGGIYYRNALFRGFGQRRLSREEVSDLLKVFRTLNFDELPTTVPDDKKPETSTLTLLCSRYQVVSVTGREALLAPLLRRMDEIAAKATSQAYFLLKPGKKVRLTILPWPYPQMSLEGFYDKKNRARTQQLYGVERVPGNLEIMHERLADDFLMKLPLTYATRSQHEDPNRYVYFAQGGKLYRVTYNPGCNPGAPYCNTFDSLDVAEVSAPDAALAATKQDYRNPIAGSFLAGTTSGWLWPPGTAVKLGGLLTNGIVISHEEYNKHKPLYFELLKAGALGANFVEDGFLYEKVKLCQIDPGFTDKCEATP